jgi:hypothetical protein
MAWASPKKSKTKTNLMEESVITLDTKGTLNGCLLMWIQEREQRTMAETNVKISANWVACQPTCHMTLLIVDTC